MGADAPVIAVAAVVCLTLLATSLLGALIYREVAHDRERQGLLDRIQNPTAAHAAAAVQMLPPVERSPEPKPYYVPVTDEDLRLSAELA